jgi:chromosome segregation ATPase
METKPTIETVLERLSAVVSMISDMDSRITNRFDALEARMSGVESRLNALEGRVSRIESRLEALEARVSGVESRLDALEVRVSGVESRLDALEVRVSGVESRLSALETQVTEGFQKVNKTLEHMKHKVEVMTQDIMDMRASLRGLDQRIPRTIEPSVA